MNKSTEMVETLVAKKVIIMAAVQKWVESLHYEMGETSDSNGSNILFCVLSCLVLSGRHFGGIIKVN